jgi:hypothetical protein
MAGIRLVQRVNELERAGDASAALDVIERAPFTPAGGPMWTSARISRLLEVASFDPLLPPWALARWVRSQALGHLARPGSTAIQAAFRDARQARLAGATGARGAADPIDAQCQVSDHDWAFAQSYLHDQGALRDFVPECSPELIARAVDVGQWCGTPMGAYRFVRDEPTTITWHDLVADVEVQTVNIGTAATLQPGEHVIGRRVTSAGDSVFDAAPLAVSEQVARAVAARPAEWVSALEERGDDPVGPRVGLGAWRGGPSGLLTDLPDSVWQDLARGHRVWEPHDDPPEDPVTEGCAHLVLDAIDDDVFLVPGSPVRDPWPVVAAAWQRPGVVEELRELLRCGHRPEAVAHLGERLGGVARMCASINAIWMLRDDDRRPV